MDLVWIPRNQDLKLKNNQWQIYMHMESENAVDLAESKDDELVKLAKSKASDLVIGFFYIYQREYDQWINEIKTKFKDFDKKVLLKAIITPCYIINTIVYYQISKKINCGK